MQSVTGDAETVAAPMQWVAPGQTHMLVPMHLEAEESGSPRTVSGLAARQQIGRQLQVASSEVNLFQLRPVPVDSCFSAAEPLAFTVNNCGKHASSAQDLALTASCQSVLHLALAASHHIVLQNRAT